MTAAPIKMGMIAEQEPGCDRSEGVHASMIERLLPTALTGLLAATLFACRHHGAKPGADESTRADTVAPASAAVDPGQVPVTVADIDRWDKGMAGELRVVEGFIAKLRDAKTGNDSLAAIMGVQEMATTPAGARAAGLDEERYRLIRSNLSSATSYLASSIGGVDTTTLSPEQRAEMKQGDDAQLEQMKGMVPADVITALTPRAAELRKKDLALVAARLKGVGM